DTASRAPQRRPSRTQRRGRHTMTGRIDYEKAAPDAYRAMLKLNQYVETCGLDRTLLELVKIRASQINRCAYCLAMHMREARALGETALRLDLLPAWREAPCYTKRERAALAFCEAMTLIADAGVPDDVYAEARAQFADDELVKLALAIVLINS